MERLAKGWFSELSPMWKGQSFSLKVDRVLFHTKSKYQDILIFENETYGKVLALDGVIQFTEKDEASYQEMIAFLPVNSHPNPAKVLIIGGGDGGVARELAKHPLVEEVTQCEIDEEVVNACKKYVPSMGCGFTNPKLKLVTGDGAKFLDETDDKYDVIITDASDPEVSEDGTDTKDGPAASLFQEAYYENMKKKLNPGGILCCQGESMWLHAKLIARLVKNCRLIFPVVEYAYTCTPSYPSGQIGFILCSLSSENTMKEPFTKWNEKQEEEFGLKYYSSEIHRAAFVLPPFFKKLLQ